jgi:molybdate transport repressor ModE-like protein
LSLDQFAVFARVGETGSFSRAARELGVSKATVSKSVAALEEALGVPLVSRTTRRAALTEAGERTLRRAQRMLEEAEAAQAEANEARAAPRGRLRVAAPLTFGVRYLTPVVGAFLEAYPEIQLELSLDDRPVDLIGEGFDAALRIRALEDSSLLARQLERIRLTLVAAPAYLNARGRPRRPEDLAMHACLHYTNQASGALWRFDGPDGDRAQVRVDGRLSANNGDVLLEMARQGLGIFLAPDFLCWNAVRDGELEPILTEWRMPELALHLLSPPGRAMPRKLRAFSDFMVERFGGGRAPWRAA